MEVDEENIYDPPKLHEEELFEQKSWKAVKATQHWIERITGEYFGYPDNFCKSLSDGKLLCNIINTLKPNCIKKINKTNNKVAWIANINEFLRACQRDFGVQKWCLFDISDLEISSEDDLNEAHISVGEHAYKCFRVAVTLFWLWRQVESTLSPEQQLDAKDFNALIHLRQTRPHVGSSYRCEITSSTNNAAGGSVASSLQFVSIGPAVELQKSALEALELSAKRREMIAAAAAAAAASSTTSDKNAFAVDGQRTGSLDDGLAVEEEWQSDLANWRNKRRQKNVCTRVDLVEIAHKEEEMEKQKDGERRKKKFSDMLRNLPSFELEVESSRENSSLSQSLNIEDADVAATTQHLSLSLKEPLLLNSVRKTTHELSSVTSDSRHFDTTIVIHRPRTTHGGFGFTLVGNQPVMVARVSIGSAADAAGLRKDDALLQINGRDVCNSFQGAVSRLLNEALKETENEVNDVNPKLIIKVRRVATQPVQQTERIDLPEVETDICATPKNEKVLLDQLDQTCDCAVVSGPLPSFDEDEKSGHVVEYVKMSVDQIVKQYNTDSSVAISNGKTTATQQSDPAFPAASFSWKKSTTFRPMRDRVQQFASKSMPQQNTPRPIRGANFSQVDPRSFSDDGQRADKGCTSAYHDTNISDGQSLTEDCRAQLNISHFDSPNEELVGSEDRGQSELRINLVSQLQTCIHKQEEEDGDECTEDKDVLKIDEQSNQECNGDLENKLQRQCGRKFEKLLETDHESQKALREAAVDPPSRSSTCAPHNHSEWLMSESYCNSSELAEASFVDLVSGLLSVAAESSWSIQNKVKQPNRDSMLTGAPSATPSYLSLAPKGSTTSRSISQQSSQHASVSSSSSAYSSKGPSSYTLASHKTCCSSCMKPLGSAPAMIIETLNMSFHLQCFRCCKCHMPLGYGDSGIDVRVFDSRLHCQTCFILQ